MVESMKLKSLYNGFNDVDNYMYKIFIAGNHDLTFDREQLFRDKSAYFDGASWTDEVA